MMDPIRLDPATRSLLEDLRRTQREVQQRIQLVCAVVINMKGKRGVAYTLSDDSSELVPVKEIDHA